MKELILISKKNRVNILKKNIFNIDILMYLFLIIISIVVCVKKDNYHVDELLTLNLSNAEYKNFFQEGNTYDSPTELFTKNLAVSQNSLFDYENTWKNQQNDVHPPLYYVLIHTICSFFPEEIYFNACIYINIIFALLTLFSVKGIANILMQKNKMACRSVSFSFVISLGILSAISFFRMYMMVMFFTTFLTMLLLKNIGAKKLNLSFFIQLYFTLYLGILTHYYFIIFSAIICFVFVLIRLINKEYKSSFLMISVGLFAVITSYITFPAMIFHIFSGYRGVETIYNAFSPFLGFKKRVSAFYNFINYEIFGGILGCILLFIALIWLLQYLLKTNHLLIRLYGFNAKSEKENAKLIFPIRYYIFITIPCLFYFLIISKIAILQQNRYLFPIYALILTVIFSFFITALFHFFGRKRGCFLFYLTLIFISINAWYNSNRLYLYKSTLPLLEETMKYQDLECLFIYNDPYQFFFPYKEIKNYKTITMVHINNLSSWNLIKNDKLIVVAVKENEALAKKIIAHYSHFNKYKKIVEFENTSTYLFQK